MKVGNLHINLSILWVICIFLSCWCSSFSFKNKIKLTSLTTLSGKKKRSFTALRTYYFFSRKFIPPDCTSCNLTCPPVARTDFDSITEGKSLSVSVPTMGLNDTYYAPVVFSPFDNRTTEKGGAVSMQKSGSYKYSPPANFTGTDFFIYEVCNAKGKPGCDTAKVFIKVLLGITKPPVAVNDTFETQENIELTGSLIANDQFIPSVNAMLVPGQGASKGKLSLEVSGQFIYDPYKGASGTDVFYYSLCNSAGSCSIAKVTIFLIDHPAESITIPTGFSPNKDGVNDYFEIKNIKAYPDNVVKIYNRWGNPVFEGKGYDNEIIRWEGNAAKNALSGESLPEGTYFYVVTLENEGKTQTGYVMLLK